MNGQRYLGPDLGYSTQYLAYSWIKICTKDDYIGNSNMSNVIQI